VEPLRKLLRAFDEALGSDEIRVASLRQISRRADKVTRCVGMVGGFAFHLAQARGQLEDMQRHHSEKRRSGNLSAWPDGKSSRRRTQHRSEARHEQGLVKVMFKMDPQQLAALRAEATRRMADRGAGLIDTSELVREAVAAWLKRQAK
jgi:hypothetical protein